MLGRYSHVCAASLMVLQVCLELDLSTGELSLNQLITSFSVNWALADDEARTFHFFLLEKETWSPANRFHHLRPRDYVLY